MVVLTVGRPDAFEVDVGVRVGKVVFVLRRGLEKDILRSQAWMDEAREAGRRVSVSLGMGNPAM